MVFVLESVRCQMRAAKNNLRAFETEHLAGLSIEATEAKNAPGSRSALASKSLHSGKAHQPVVNSSLVGQRQVGRELPCKPDSVRLDLTRAADDHFSGTGVASGLERPTRKAWTGSTSCTFPIWSFSGWGLPCQPCHQDRGALLPHRFTLAAQAEAWGRRSILCGTFPNLAVGCR